MSSDANDMMNKAEKRASGVGRLLSWFTGNTEKLEDAAELYTAAANKYKMDKECKFLW
jgi:alpha-soluble NSF attachment protein